MRRAPTLSIYPVPQRSVVVQHDLQLDPAAPVFFLSYSGAHARGAVADTVKQRNYVEQFFVEVSESVNELLALRTGQAPGVLNVEIQAGDRWEQRILNAIGHCQVFVPLISRRFLASEWCRFEWESFARRGIRR